MIPPRQDRRGFYEFFVLSCIIFVCSLLGLLYASENDVVRQRISIAFAIIGVTGFVTAEGLSRPPHNGPHEFVLEELQKGKRDEDERVLVCLGDSLTHGACSAKWVDGIIPALMARQRCNRNSLKVVNAGQNSICTHTVLNEKMDHVITCRPDYVFVLIGTNDVMAMYRQDWANEKKRLWKLPDVPTEDIMFRNLADIVTRLLDQTSAKIAVGTLPPWGEDSNAAANILIQKMNRGIIKIAQDKEGSKRVTLIDINEALWQRIRDSQDSRISFHRVDNFLPYAAVMGIFHCVLGIGWTTLAQLFTGNVVLSESLHLNEVGADIIKDEVVRWLIQFDSTNETNQNR